mgnify:FL=1
MDYSNTNKLYIYTSLFDQNMVWCCVPNVSAGLTPWLLQKFHFRDSEPLITLIHTLPTLIKAMTL